MLSLEGVSVRYPGSGVSSLVGATLEIDDGQVTGVAGASESGKTTLCLVASGIIPRVTRATLTGRVRIEGEDIGSRPMHALAGRVGVLTGTPETLLSLVADTVFEEVAFGPANLGVAREDVIARVEAALAAVGLTGLEERDPRKLSTGQTQLVGIAGLLAMGSRYLVLDEPSTHLDADATARLVAVLRRLAEGGAGVLVASQDTRLLATACDRVAVLDRGHVGPAGPTSDTLGDPRIAEGGLEPLEPGSPP